MHIRSSFLKSPAIFFGTEVWILSQEEEIVVPQMVGFEGLTKIIIGYLKVGGDKEEKTNAEVAAVANVAQANVGRNGRFLRSIGIIEGRRGRHKLTPEGTKYAQSLDWGRLDEANKLLGELLKDKPIVKRALGFVDINAPVERDALVSRIAIIAGVSRQTRYETGIRGFIDMLVTSGLLDEREGNLVPGKLPRVPKEIPERKKVIAEPSVAIEMPKRLELPVSLNININDETDIENLKKILKAIKEVFSED